MYKILACIICWKKDFCKNRYAKICKQNIFSYYAAAMSGICYLIIVSMAESAFVHPIAVPIAMMIGAFLGKCE